MRKKIYYLILLTCLCSGLAVAQTATNGKKPLREVCDKSVGQWFGEEGGFWNCCWSNWGCLQCEPSGNCDLFCENQACTMANDPTGSNIPKDDRVRVKGLTPDTMQDPVVPKNPTPFIKIPLMKPGEVKQTM